MNSRNMTQKFISLYLYKIHFCLIWKPNGSSFVQTKQEVKINFTIVDSVISDKGVESFVNYEYDL